MWGWVMKQFYLIFVGLVLLLYGSGCGSQLAPANTLLAPPTPTPCVPTPVLYRVNCGDVAYTDSCSNAWAADQAYASGLWGYQNVGSIGGPGTTPIGNTTDDPLFYKERYAATLEYRFDVAAGNYDVTLWFCEGYFTAANKRVFDVVVEGVSFAASLDVFSLVGAKKAYSLSGNVPVSDGTLNIVMTATADNAQINAIEVK